MDSTVRFIADPETHVMGASLGSYIEQKIHPDLKNEAVARIVVEGLLVQRLEPARIAPFERKEPIDSHRPTTTILDPTTVRLNCFPSANFIQHYASLVATYLSLHGKDPAIVELIFPEANLTSSLISESNIRDIGPVDIAIIGHVHHLKGLHSGSWQGDGESDIFRWQKFISPKGEKVALIGCKETLWGQTGYYLIQTLYSQFRARSVIYIAKAGALLKQVSPNEWIATGSHTFVEGESLQWHNPLDRAIASSKKVIPGPIVTVPSTLCENKDWLNEWSSRSPGCTWVDCEVGYLAKAAIELGIEFGFLHIVSDNLWQNFEEDLSNEESDTVISKRERLYDEIVTIIKSFLQS